MTRIDGRLLDQLREVKIQVGYQKFAPASCLIEVGDTRVVCSAYVEERVPPFLKGSGQGWLSAEYGMLPGSCKERVQREAAQGRVRGRTHEIQRLIGRSLRAVMDLTRLGERSIWIDCDVLQGDGGTRTAGITGSFIALAHVLQNLRRDGKLVDDLLHDYVAAISVGTVDQHAMLDLCYAEDSKAEVDMNVVMTGSGRFVEVQGTAEHEPFSGVQLNQLLNLAEKGVSELIAIQKRYVKLPLRVS